MVNTFQKDDAVILKSTEEEGIVIMTDDTYKQAEVGFEDNSSAVYFYKELRKVEN